MRELFLKFAVQCFVFLDENIDIWTWYAKRLVIIALREWRRNAVDLAKGSRICNAPDGINLCE